MDPTERRKLAMRVRQILSRRQELRQQKDIFWIDAFLFSFLKDASELPKSRVVRADDPAGACLGFRQIETVNGENGMNFQVTNGQRYLMPIECVEPLDEEETDLMED